ncbi:MAG: type IIL restriction-modification enzyme MmeI, partial [Saprospiraceae bacterium]
KTEANKDYLMTDADYRLTLGGYKGWQSPKVAKAAAVAFERRFFHWFLEFPEVFAAGGFDCVVGNPPFLGDKKLRRALGEFYIEWLRFYFSRAGLIDLVAYFFRRNYSIINSKGFVSIISTNSIAQGDTREGGLEYLMKIGANVNFAISSIKWPGNAAVQVSLLGVTKRLSISKFLNGKPVDKISSYLDSENDKMQPFLLSGKSDDAFVGVYANGSGFVIEKVEAESLIQNNEKNLDVVFPYLTGGELNNSPNLSPERFTINFKDWDYESALKYPDCLSILTERVKPFREKVISAGGQIHEYDYWKYWDKRLEKFTQIKRNSKVLVLARVSKTLAFTFVENSNVIADSVVVFVYNNFNSFSILQSNIHHHWIWKYCTTMKTDPNYGPSKVFQNFPFPKNISKSQEVQLETIGKTYHEHRRQLMLGMWLGLTRTYNLFHTKELPTPEEAEAISALPPKAIEKQYGKEVGKLVRHLAENEAAMYTLEQALAGIRRLRALHVEMDQAVLEAYGWSDIALRHDFYEVDYLPEHDRVRFTIHPEARKEVLRRLLELNHAVYAEEVARGLHGKGKGNKKKVSADAEAGEDGGHLGEQGTLF